MIRGISWNRKRPCDGHRYFQAGNEKKSAKKHSLPATIAVKLSQGGKHMHLSPKEQDKLLLLSMGLIAERRLKKGLKLNYPEAVAYITSAALEGAREGKTVEEVMHGAANVLKKDQVMEGVADMIDLLQVEAVFTDGSRLVSIHQPIK